MAGNPVGGTSAAPAEKTTRGREGAAKQQIMEEGEEGVMETASHLSRRQVVERRRRRLKQLGRIYRAHYWALMEDLRSKYRLYYWNYGKSPFRRRPRPLPCTTSPSVVVGNSAVKNEAEAADDEKEEEEEEEEEEVRKCRVGGCKSKAMPFTSFCHSHILSDSLQSLYLPCSFPLKFSHGKPVLCGKPTLRSTVPSLCPPHFHKAESYLARALRKEGVPISSSSSNKVSPEFHLIVAEFVRHIQNKRRSALQP